MARDITEVGLRKQEELQRKGADLVSDKFFRGVRKFIRAEINRNAFKPHMIDLKQLNDKIAQAMTIVFLVSSGKILQSKEDVFEFSAPSIDALGFRFDLPFKEALDIWRKHNPGEEGLLNIVLGSSNTIANNFTTSLENLMTIGVNNILTSGWTVPQVVRKLATQADKTAGEFETALRTSVGTAQNAGHQKRMMDNPNIAILEYRVPKDPRTTGAKPGVYGTKKTQHRNPGFCLQLSGFRAVPDHPIWQTIYPLNHFNCRGKVVAITFARADSLGLLNKDGTVKAKYVNPTIPAFVADGRWPAEGFQQAPLTFLGAA